MKLYHLMRERDVYDESIGIFSSIPAVISYYNKMEVKYYTLFVVEIEVDNPNHLEVIKDLF